MYILAHEVYKYTLQSVNFIYMRKGILAKCEYFKELIHVYTVFWIVLKLM